MIRRDRLANKLAKREEWGAKAATRSEQAFQRSDAIGERFAGGQPILIGHHSEGKARRDQERMHGQMDKAVEQSDLAKHHASKAVGLAHQLDKSIFSDDADAFEAIEARIADREAQATAMVAVNKAWRKAKGDVEKFAELAGLSLGAAQIIANRIASAYSWEKQPYVSWELSNLRGTITRDKKRLEEIKARQARAEQSDAAGGVLIEGTEDVRVTFAEKPDRSILDALKAADFTWSGGSWYGRRAKLPEGIQ